MTTGPSVEFTPASSQAFVAEEPPIAFPLFPELLRSTVPALFIVGIPFESTKELI